MNFYKAVVLHLESVLFHLAVQLEVFHFLVKKAVAYQRLYEIESSCCGLYGVILYVYLLASFLSLSFLEQEIINNEQISIAIKNNSFFILLRILIGFIFSSDHVLAILDYRLLL